MAIEPPGQVLVMEQVDLTRERQLKELLEGALDRSAEERTAYLSAHCGDESLAAEALALLEADEQDTDFLRHSAAERLGAAAQADAWPPEGVGNYRNEGIIGEGGMGVVYAASQAEPVERRVAIKLMHPFLAAPNDRTRFEAERQALARLSHPNIAQMYEAGSTGGGRPYFVMELIDGKPVDQYCDERSLGIKARLRIFVSICGAVEHAHRRQLLHRDLKPSNVLVVESEGGPVPKVIDFGIAKVLDASNEPLATSAFKVRGTPSYISPEVMRGEDPDTRADIYSLGVLLFGLLGGERSFGSSDALQGAQADEPMGPSRPMAQAGSDSVRVGRARTGTSALRVEPRTDLSWIVAKALSPEADGRYGSAAELAADVERYLGHWPVAARPATLCYRAIKWSQRHRNAALVGVLAVLATITAVFLGVGHAIDLERERAATEQARHQAEGLVTLLLDDVYDEVEPLAQRDFLERIADQVELYFEALPPDLRSASAVGHARALRNSGRIKLQRADIEGGQAAFEAAMALDRLAIERDAGPEAVRGLALDYRRTADALERLGRRDAVLEAVEMAVALRRQLFEDDPTAIENRFELSYDLSELGWARRDLGQIDGAIAAFEECVDIRRRLVGSKASAESRRWLGTVLKDLGVTIAMNGEPVRGVQMSREAVALLEAVHEEHPGRRDYAVELATAWNSLAATLAKMGDLDGSIAATRKSMPLFERWVEHDPTDVRARGWLATSRLRMAENLRLRGDLSAADRELELTIEVLEDVPLDLEGSVLVARALLMLGRVEEARPLVERVIAAGSLENRPRFAKLCRQAGLLP